jgi:hypothetical protein
VSLFGSTERVWLVCPLPAVLQRVPHYQSRGNSPCHHNPRGTSWSQSRGVGIIFEGCRFWSLAGCATSLHLRHLMWVGPWRRSSTVELVEAGEPRMVSSLSPHLGLAWHLLGHVIGKDTVCVWTTVNYPFRELLSQKRSGSTAGPSCVSPTTPNHSDSRANQLLRT